MADGTGKRAREIEKLVTALRDVRDQILDSSSMVTAERRDEVFLGTWDLKDLLAHLIGWDYTNVAAIGELTAGRLPAFYAAYDRDWAAFNAGLVQRYKTDDWDALVESVRGSQQAAAEALRSLPAEELERDRGLVWRDHRITLRGILNAALRDERVHSEQIRAFARSGTRGSPRTKPIA